MKQIKNSELLTKMLVRPTLYVGSDSIIRIKSFLDGYGSAICDMGGELNDPLYDGFQRFLAERFNFGHSLGWDSIICSIDANELNALNLTRQLWQEYCTEHLKQHDTD